MGSCGEPPKLIAIGIAPLGIISIGVVPMGVVSIGVVPMGAISLGVVGDGRGECLRRGHGRCGGRDQCDGYLVDQSWQWTSTPQQRRCPGATDGLHEQAGRP